jgi:hypothetical protein
MLDFEKARREFFCVPALRHLESARQALDADIPGSKEMYVEGEGKLKVSVERPEEEQAKVGM